MKVVLSTLDRGPVSRIGIGAFPGQDALCVSAAWRGEVNLFFFYHLGQEAFVSALASLVAEQRKRIFIATGSSERTDAGVLADFAAARERLAVASIDAFFVEYVSPADDEASILGPGGVLDVLQEAKRAGLIRYVGASVHDRNLAVRLVESGKIDVLMHRLNMAHRGATDRVLPAAAARGVPVWAFTATRWGTLLEGHPQWQDRPPTAAECYRYCLSQESVAAVIAAPKSLAELDGALSAHREGRLPDPKCARWDQYGELVYGSGKDRFETEWP